MDLFNQLLEIYPDLTNRDFHPEYGSILLCDDGDGEQYIVKWDYEEPLPKGFKIGK